MQSSDFWNTNTSLYGSPALMCGFVHCKTATLELKLHASMGPRHDLWFCECKTALLAAKKLVCNGTQTLICGFPAHITACFWIRIKRQLWFPDLTYGFVACTTATSALELLISFGVSSHLRLFACKPASFGPKLHVSMCPWHHLWFSAC